MIFRIEKWGTVACWTIKPKKDQLDEKRSGEREKFLPKIIQPEINSINERATSVRACESLQYPHQFLEDLNEAYVPLKICAFLCFQILIAYWDNNEDLHEKLVLISPCCTTKWIRARRPLGAAVRIDLEKLPSVPASRPRRSLARHQFPPARRSPPERERNKCVWERESGRGGGALADKQGGGGCHTLKFPISGCE
jgi:hypothetical protein